jgi:hypothetical protein
MDDLKEIVNGLREARIALENSLANNKECSKVLLPDCLGPQKK